MLNDFTFIDLFAGIGGIRLGFEAHGGQCVFTSEWNAYAQKTYRANFKNDYIIEDDIKRINASDIPDHDVLLAGFPCQPFSIAGISNRNALGRKHGFECTTDGTAFFDVARIIAAKRPKAFFLENVKNLFFHNKGNTFAIIKDILENQLNYHISYRVIDGQHFVPQHRERIFIVGFCVNTAFNWDAIPLPELTINSPKLQDILHRENGSETDNDNERYIDSNGDVHQKYILTNQLWDYFQIHAEKQRAKGNRFGYSIARRDNISRTLTARYYKDGSEILIERGYNKNPRRLTPRECARLMGYSDDFRIVCSDTQAYRQFGNSVVVPLISHIAALMKPSIMELKNSKP